MARSLFKGSVCKKQCKGHRAGYKYAKDGGTQFSSNSTSFNNGMKIAMGLLPKRRK